MHNSDLVYGLRDNILTHISKVERGFKCNCICSFCKEELNAKQGGKNKHHFAHKSGADCPNAYESALHLLAKEVLLKSKRIYLPYFPIEETDYFEILPFNLETQRLTVLANEVILEENINENGIRVKPDAIIKVGDREIFIEFANTHFVDYDKRYKLETLKKECIEIDIRGLELNSRSLESYLSNYNESSYWINNIESKKEFEEKYNSYKSEFRTAIGNYILQYPNLRLPNYSTVLHNKRRGINNYDLLFDHDGNKKYFDLKGYNILLKDTPKAIQFFNEHRLNGLGVDGVISIGKKQFLFRLFINEEKEKRDLLKVKNINFPILDFILLNNEVEYSSSGIAEFFSVQLFGKVWSRHPKEENNELKSRLRKRIEVRNIEKQNKVLLKQYMNDETFLVFNQDDKLNLKKYCPKKNSVYKDLKKEHFYDHPVVCKIIDGLEWNMEIYGKGDWGKYIFLKGYKVYVYPPDCIEPEENSVVPKGSSGEFFKGLMKIKEAERLIGDCQRCRHLFTEISSDNEVHFVCGFKKRNSRI